jgi:hypothetical protein
MLSFLVNLITLSMAHCSAAAVGAGAALGVFAFVGYIQI